MAPTTLPNKAKAKRVDTSADFAPTAQSDVNPPRIVIRITRSLMGLLPIEISLLARLRHWRFESRA